MFRTSTRRFLCSFLLFLACTVVVSHSAAVEYRKKKATQGATFGSTPQSTADASVAKNLQPFYTESGRLHLSVDGVGTVLSFGTVEVEKPRNATVKRAFLMAASGGYGGGEIADGEVRVEGRRILWSQSIPNVVGGWNAMADVTDLIAQKIDAAAPGTIIVEIAEEKSDFVDGVVLAVVFEVMDDSVINDDISLYFGAHGAASNGFTLELSEPVPADLSTTRYELGLGISFSLQTSTVAEQYSVIDVNGHRLTAAAGGPDDGSPLASALLSVGGLSDDTANPTDATATPVNLASDDEYYDLTAFVKAGDTRIEVATANPSKNDNLFFASFVARRNAAPSVAPQMVAAPIFLGGSVARNQPIDQIILASSAAQSAVGSQGEITATVMSGGVPLPGIDVQLQIVSGPHAGATSTAQTNASGRARFLYRGTARGTDLIVAMVDNGGSAVAGSNVVLYEWVDEMRALIDIEPGSCPSTFDPRMQDVVTVALLGTEHFDVNDVDATSLYLENAVPIRVQYQDISQPGDGVDCPCSASGRDGREDIVMLFRITDLFANPNGLSGNQTQQLTLTGTLDSGSSFEASNCVVVSGSSNTTTVPNNVLIPTEEGFDSNR